MDAFDEFNNYMQYGEMDKALEFLQETDYEELVEGKRYGLNLVHLASRYGQVSHLKLLIKKGLNPNEVDYEKVSPLDDAIIHKKDENVSFLLNFYDPKTFNYNFPFNPLLFARSLEMFKTIFDYLYNNSFFFTNKKEFLVNNLEEKILKPVKHQHDDEIIDFLIQEIYCFNVKFLFTLLIV
jgi:hypothetical protein